jgi:hypothetical protein
VRTRCSQVHARSRSRANDPHRPDEPHAACLGPTLVTPPHAGWLNQAELLLRAFSERYLKRGDWKSRQQLIEHLDADWREYNERFAHPITWSWTRQKMRQWVARRASGLC